jgi:hypothetical protein
VARVSPVIKTVEATIDERGGVHLLEPLTLSRSQRALVTILEEGPAPNADETSRRSEAALAADWTRPEEEAAWAHMQRGR